MRMVSEHIRPVWREVARLTDEQRGSEPTLGRTTGQLTFRNLHGMNP